MAKFVQVGYGSKGETKTYTYLVADSTRVNQTIFPAVKHYGNGKIFGTTGVVKETSKTNKSGLNRDDITEYQSPSELGVPKERGEKGRFVTTAGTHDEQGNYIASTTGKYTRGANIVALQEKSENKISSGVKTGEALETFEQYANKFGG